VLLSLNISLSFYKLSMLLQMLGGIGQNIVAVISSLVSGRMPQMLMISTIVLLMFVAVFNVLIRDESSEYNFLYLYRGLIFGDGDGLDFMGMKTDYTDDGQPEPHETMFHARTKCFIMTFATIVFNVVLMNLVIAVYGNEYDSMAELSESLFTRLRAEYCSRVLMLCSSTDGSVSYSTLITQKTGLLSCGYVVSLVLLAFGTCWLTRSDGVSYITAVCVAGGLLLLRERIMDAQSHWFDEAKTKDENLYLWIAHKDTYEKERFLTKDQKEDKAGDEFDGLADKIDELHETLTEETGSQTVSDFQELKERVDILDRQMQKVLQAVKTLRRMNVAPRRPSTAD